jgi:hypothetical protein
MVPSPVQQADWLPLFLPYVALRDDPVLAHRCPSRTAGPTPNPVQTDSNDSDAAALLREAADRARSEASAACLARLWQVSLDGKPVALDTFVATERADLGLRGLGGFIDLRGLEPGPHVVEVVWRPNPESDPPLDDYVPQRFRTVIPFVWSPSD